MRHSHFIIIILPILLYACSGSTPLGSSAEEKPLTPNEQFDAFVDSTAKLQELQKFLVKESRDVLSNALNKIDEDHKGSAQVVLGKKLSELSIVDSRADDGSINSLIGLGSGIFSLFMDQEKIEEAEKMLEPDLDYLKSIKDYHQVSREREKLFYLQIRELLLDNPSHFDPTTSRELITTIEESYFQDQRQNSSIQDDSKSASIISTLINAYIDGGDPMHDRDPHSRCHQCSGAGKILISWSGTSEEWEVCGDCNGTGYGNKY